MSTKTIIKKLSKVTSKKIEQFRENLIIKGYVFKDSDFIELNQKNKLIIDLKKAGKEYVGYLLLNDNLRNIFINEISTLRLLNDRNFSHGPKITDYSDVKCWMIRQKIAGNVAGNIYQIYKSNLSNNEVTDTLIEILGFFIGIKSDHNSAVSAGEMISYLKSKIGPNRVKNVQSTVLISQVCERLSLNRQLIDKKNLMGFLHGDIQPTNIIVNHNKEIFVIDFEKAGRGNILFDFTSLYHRREDDTRWQKEILKKYVKKLHSLKINFDENSFNLFHMYFLSLDIASLDMVYLNNNQGTDPYRFTDFDKKKAQKLYDLYVKKLSDILKLLGEK